MKNKKNSFLILLTLGLLTALAPFSIDMYLPAFPDIAKGLGVSIETIQLSLASYFVGLSVGQLLAGPLSDRFGRKPPLLGGLLLYTLVSVACSFAATAYWLISLRFFQALGGCVGVVVSRAIVSDLYPVKERAGIFSTLMLVMGVAPIVAPSLGSFLSASLGWQSVFIALSIVGILAIAGTLYLPETKGNDFSISIRPGLLLKSYLSILRNQKFLVYSFCGGLGNAAMFAYISGSPFVYMELFGLTEIQYGWAFGINALGLITGGQVNRKLLRYYSSARILTIVVYIQLITGLLLWFGAWMGYSALFILPLVFVFVSSLGYVLPNTTALAMAPFIRDSGTASAVLGFLQYVIAAGSAALVSGLHNGTAIPMTLTIALSAMASFIITLTGNVKFRREEEA